eukprot:TRINITY_DN6582_c0_g1_i5.p1 TRINITY_DN6582_c0_g1~~TRINITY_DN6582_c0_g1_i5.p1  ORF type:complete len:107 (-),score=17.70 TRINITY_DN6582_c0_g1_i5:49-369(-)
MRKKRIPLEICLSSNVMAGHYHSYLQHHFKHFHSWDYPISLCTDDSGVFTVTSTHEHITAANSFGLSEEDLFVLTLRAVDFTFTTSQEKEKLKTRLFDWYSDWQNM